MVEINLGDSAQSVRAKLGMADLDYHTAWRVINVKCVPNLAVCYADHDAEQSPRYMSCKIWQQTP